MVPHGTEAQPVEAALPRADDAAQRGGLGLRDVGRETVAALVHGLGQRRHRGPGAGGDRAVTGLVHDDAGERSGREGEVDLADRATPVRLVPVADRNDGE